MVEKLRAIIQKDYGRDISFEDAKKFGESLTELFGDMLVRRIKAEERVNAQNKAVPATAKKHDQTTVH